ncbi:MAG: hypothetical protein Q9165_002207 [Trypethelium subeluteriae]
MSDDETTSDSSNDEDIDFIGTDIQAGPDRGTKIDLASGDENLALVGADDRLREAPQLQESSSPDVPLQELTSTIRGAKKRSAGKRVQPYHASALPSENPTGGRNEQTSPGGFQIGDGYRDELQIQQSPSLTQESPLPDQRRYPEEGLIVMTSQGPSFQTAGLASVPPRNLSMAPDAMEESHFESPPETRQQARLRVLQQQRAQAEANYAISQQEAMDWTSELDQSIRLQANAQQRLWRARENEVSWKREWNRVDQEIARLFNSESQPHPHQTASGLYLPAQLPIQRQNVLQDQSRITSSAPPPSLISVTNAIPAEEPQVPGILRQEQTTQGSGQIGQRHSQSSPQPRDMSVDNARFPESRITHEPVQSAEEERPPQAGIPCSRIPSGTGHWRRASTIAPSSLPSQMLPAMQSNYSSVHDPPSAFSEARASERTRTDTSLPEQRTSRFSQP